MYNCVSEIDHLQSLRRIQSAASCLGNLASPPQGISRGKSIPPTTVPLRIWSFLGEYLLMARGICWSEQC